MGLENLSGLEIILKYYVATIPRSKTMRGKPAYFVFTESDWDYVYSKEYLPSFTSDI